MEHQAEPGRADGPGVEAPEQAAGERAAGPSAAHARGEDAPEQDVLGQDAAATGGAPAPVGGEQFRAVTAGVPASVTGEPRVDAALKLLERLPGLPVADHAELFEQVHAQLSEVLGELDSGFSGPAGS